MARGERELMETFVERHFFWTQEDNDGEFEAVTRQDLSPGSINKEPKRDRYVVTQLIYRKGDQLEFDLLTLLPQDLGFPAIYFPGCASDLKSYASIGGNVFFEDLTIRQQLFGFLHDLGKLNIWQKLSWEELDNHRQARNALLLGSKKDRPSTVVLMDEYQAWEWTLKVIEQLKQQDIDLFLGVGQEQFNKWVDQSRQPLTHGP